MPKPLCQMCRCEDCVVKREIARGIRKASRERRKITDPIDKESQRFLRSRGVIVTLKECRLLNREHGIYAIAEKRMAQLKERTNGQRV